MATTEQSPHTAGETRTAPQLTTRVLVIAAKKIMTPFTWFKQKCVNCAPQRRRSPVGGGPTHVVVGKHGSYRAAWPGNRPGRSLGTRVRLGRAAILQVVTRVKLEQASKVCMWTPTRQLTGEGRAGRERNRQAPVRSTGVVSTACKKGDLGNWGRSGSGEGRTFNIIYRVVASPEVG